MLKADNDNGHFVEFAAAPATALMIRTLATRLGAEDDSELLELAIGAYEQTEGAYTENTSTPEAATALCRFPVSRDAAEAIRTAKLDTGLTDAEIVARGFEALLSITGRSARTGAVVALRG